MKTRIGAFIALTGMALVLMDPAPARALTVIRQVDKGGSADFDSSDPSQCIFIHVNIDTAEDGYLNPPGGPEVSLPTEVIMTYEDTCNFRFGFFVGDNSPLTTHGDIKLEINNSLSSAHLTGTITIDDLEGEFGGFDVVIDLTWTATSKAQKVSTYRNGGPIPVTIQNGVLRNATAVGSVIGAGPGGTQNFTPNPSVAGELGTGTTTIVEP